MSIRLSYPTRVQHIGGIIGAHDDRDANLVTDNGSVGRAAAMVGDDRRRALHDRRPDWSVVAVTRMQPSMDLPNQGADSVR